MFQLRKPAPVSAVEAANSAMTRSARRVADLRRAAEDAGEPANRLSQMRAAIEATRRDLAAQGMAVNDVAAAIAATVREADDFERSNAKALARGVVAIQELAAAQAAHAIQSWEAANADMMAAAQGYEAAASKCRAAFAEFAAHCFALDQRKVPGRPQVALGIKTVMALPGPLNLPHLAHLREPHDLSGVIEARARDILAAAGE